jgi:tRNA(Ile)-lysidine synthase
VDSTRSGVAVRLAVRRWLAEHPADRVVVALSGGCDSLALAAAAAAEAPSVCAIVVDHGLQDGSAAVAERAAAQARELGCATATVMRVEVAGPGGPEASARRARYAALASARGDAPVLLGHTLDDQAETVLLGLGRGSGPRSMRAMASWDPPYGRPFLGVRRDETRQACVEFGVIPWDDPHNDDPSFTRVRLRREVLPLLEDVLSGGVAPALARTAEQLREDGEVLDALADDLYERARRDSDLDVTILIYAPRATRRRALRRWLLDGGAKSLVDSQLRAVDDLVGRWRGQGSVAVGLFEPGVRLVASRSRGRLTIGPENYE